MRFMMMIKGDQNYEQGVPPRPELEAELGKFYDEMARAGVLLEAGGLLPSVKGAKIRAAGGRLTVVDGPFTGARELVGGFAVIQARSKEEAVELASRFMRMIVKVEGPAYEGECELRQMSAY